MYIKNPDGKSLINIEFYSYIHMCDINTTHLDFYIKVPKKGKRGTPDLILEFDDTERRKDFFNSLTKAVTKI